MRECFTRVPAALAVGAAVVTLGVTGTSASQASTMAGRTAGAPALRHSQPPAVPGARVWLKRYNGSGNKDDTGASVAVSPGGKTVFVTGTSEGGASGADYATVAYSAATGAKLWAARYNGPANGSDTASSVAVSPGGKTVFVTGTSNGDASNGDYATVAYNATTGARLWVTRYNDPSNQFDEAASVAVSPTGREVFVTGNSFASSGEGAVTIAYDSATGAQLWAAVFLGGGASSLAVGPAGGKVFITGSMNSDYVTVAYSAATGAQLWVSRYSRLSNGGDYAYSVAVGPGGGRVYVTGVSYGGKTDADYATVAYSAATGAQLWVSRYNGANHVDQASSIAVSPLGGKVFVTGFSYGKSSDADYATVAYSAANGARIWARRYNGRANGFDRAYSVAVSATGREVFVTGNSKGIASGRDYATLAYQVTTGALIWARRYNGPANGFDHALSVAVSPTGRDVFVTGGSANTSSGADYVTIAYRG